MLFALTWIGIGCWGVCFWWMHRISTRQDSMLKELHEMTSRIESLSHAEHDLIREVHPKVDELKESVEDVAQKVADGNKMSS
jgi:rRNA maturation endonuclease Nob1